MARGLCKACRHCRVIDGKVDVHLRADGIMYGDKLLLTRDRLMVYCLKRKAAGLGGLVKLDTEGDCFEARDEYAPLTRVPVTMWGDEC